MNLTVIKKMIKDRTGLRFEKQFSEKIRAAIHELMKERKIESENSYFEILNHDPDEFTRLMDLLTINETYFFREPVQLDLFSNRLIPGLLQKQGQKRRIRMLSAGCSTGEEPYSLVIALMEKYGRDIGHLFSFAGVDIDGEAVRKAKQGIYGEHAFRSLAPYLKNAYFDDLGNGTYKMKAFVKEMVTFENFNLLADPGSVPFKGKDIIFYRNVSIYFDPKTQKRIFNNLSRMLNDNGYLILSSTETHLHDMRILSLTEMDGLFLFVKALTPHPSGHNRKPAEVLKTRGPGMLQPGTKKEDNKTRLSQEDLTYTGQYDALKEVKQKKERPKSPDQQLDEALVLAEEKQYDEALSLIDDLLAEEPEFIRACNAKAGILVNLNRIEAAERICLKVIEKDLLCLESYLLLGIIARENNEASTAVKRFKEALYVKSSCWLAHFHLAELFASKGEKGPARQEYQITMNLLEKEGGDNPGISFFPIRATTRQIIALCRSHLSTI